LINNGDDVLATKILPQTAVLYRSAALQLRQSHSEMKGYCAVGLQNLILRCRLDEPPIPEQQKGGPHCGTRRSWHTTCAQTEYLTQRLI
jgi:hypothetical protein